MNKDRKIKWNPNSRVLTEKTIDEWIDPNGQKFRKTAWEEQTKPLNLGSLAKPQNEHILNIKIEVDSEKKMGDNPLGDVFRMFKV